MGPFLTCGPKCGLRADDSQFYILFGKFVDLARPLAKIEGCIKDIKQWMKTNYLKLNDEKTEVLLLGTRSALNTLLRITVIIGDSQLKLISILETWGSFLTRNYLRTAQSESVDLLCIISGAFPAFANFLILTLVNPLYMFWLHHASTM